MNSILLFLHFFGLMLGAAGGMASGIIMRKALSMPAENAQVVRSLGPTLTKVGGAGLLLLWITGLLLVWTRWDGFANLPQLFWVKAIFIVSLTVIHLLIEKTYADVRRGNAAAAAWLPKLGPLGGVSALLAVLFAAFAFN